MQAGSNPEAARFLERLGTFARVAVFDRRGMGLSDPLSGPDTLEEQVEDLGAVIDAVGFQRPALLGLSDQGRTCILFAAMHPGRTRALVTAGTAPYGAAVMTPECAQSLRDAVEHAWGQAQLIGIYAPRRVDDLVFKEWCMRGERMSASPQAMLNLIDTITRADVRGVLPSVQTPTLVLHRSGDRLVSVELGQELADSIVGSTERASALGDARWRKLRCATTRHGVDSNRVSSAVEHSRQHRLNHEMRRFTMDARHDRVILRR